MKQQEFMKQLKKELYFCPRDEKEQILMDYENYFEQGKESGKSEEELCELFGNPKDIADRMPGAEDKEKVKWQNIMMICGCILIAVFAWLGIYAVKRQVSQSNSVVSYTPYFVGYSILFPSVIWFLIKGFLPKQMRVDDKKIFQLQGNLLLIMEGIIFLLAIFMQLVIVPRAISIFGGTQAEVMLNLIFQGLSYAIGAILVIGVILLRRGNAYAMKSISQGFAEIVGIMMYSMSITVWEKVSDDQSGIVLYTVKHLSGSGLLSVGIVFLAGFIIMSIFWIIMKRLDA